MGWVVGTLVLVGAFFWIRRNRRLRNELVDNNVPPSPVIDPNAPVRPRGPRK